VSSTAFEVWIYGFFHGEGGFEVFLFFLNVLLKFDFMAFGVILKHLEVDKINYPRAVE
jgi:hypothetical protein